MPLASHQWAGLSFVSMLVKQLNWCVVCPVSNLALLLLLLLKLRPSSDSKKAEEQHPSRVLARTDVDNVTEQFRQLRITQAHRRKVFQYHTHHGYQAGQLVHACENWQWSSSVYW
ncbi:unnamed protein product [Ostreobium quekettii]|uniref:Uncharacterized protein n=1 Tax=Ostreobium quekettii TaxID=121088 RepID=A0A8S1JGK9_9CHLO|nr:unnamed protein product [Ostreobium quekettii]|eukprot:evm.model.scf_854.8 EVM.evm.TU.scf_854.8   scf_854:46111-47996(+)